MGIVKHLKSLPAITITPSSPLVPASTTVPSAPPQDQFLTVPTSTPWQPPVQTMQSGPSLEPAVPVGPVGPVGMTIGTPISGSITQWNQPSPLGASSRNDIGAISSRLQKTIAEKNLEKFYDENAVQAVISKVQTIHFETIAGMWNISREKAYDLANLALYRVVLFVDDGYNMMYAENGERMQDLRFVLKQLIDVVSAITDSVYVVFANSGVQAELTNSAQVDSLLGQCRFGTTTALGASMDRHVLRPLLLGPAGSNSMSKPLMVVTLVSDAPESEAPDAFRTFLINCKSVLEKTVYGTAALQVQVAQLGNDKKALAFVESLQRDDSLQDIVKCLTSFENESEKAARQGFVLTPGRWLAEMVTVG